MRIQAYPVAGCGPPHSDRLVQKQALQAARKSREIVALLERTLRLIVEEDSIQPALDHVYAVLCEAETRATILENWYERTYADRYGPGE